MSKIYTSSGTKSEPLLRAKGCLIDSEAIQLESLTDMSGSDLTQIATEVSSVGSKGQFVAPVVVCGVYILLIYQILNQMIFLCKYILR